MDSNEHGKFVRGFWVEPGFMGDDPDGADKLATLTVAFHSVPISEFTLAEATDYENEDIPLGVEQHFYVPTAGARKLGELLIRAADALDHVAANPPAEDD